MSENEKQDMLRPIADQMLAAAGEIDFEKAAKLRDKLFELRGQAPADKPQPKHRHRREHLKHGK
jgi:excinuclease UvrABC helicase subunit UvrB